MRSTFTIDDDLFAAVRSLARAESQPIGRVVSDLLRRGLNATPRIDTEAGNDFPVFTVPKDSPPITLEDVKKLEDEM